MKAFVCIDAQDWESVIRGVARHLPAGGGPAPHPPPAERLEPPPPGPPPDERARDELSVTLAHVVDERAPRGFEMSVRGLLGRRRPANAEERMSRAAREAAEDLLADAGNLLRQLSPGATVETSALDGDPNHELMRAAGEIGTQTIFVGRGRPGSQPRATVSGVVEGWNQNSAGRYDGLRLADGTEVRFPHERAEPVRDVISEGAEVEATGVWQGRRVLHAYSVTDVRTGTPVEAHAAPDEQPGERPLGHTARFVVDHALCDVVVLSL